jgi:hypothetical protein
LIAHAVGAPRIESHASVGRVEPLHIAPSANGQSAGLPGMLEERHAHIHTVSRNTHCGLDLLEELCGKFEDNLTNCFL